jgi:hypothetical protein
VHRDEGADTIGLWLDKSLNRAAPLGTTNEGSPIPTNLEGVRHLLGSLEALSDHEFFTGMACTKLWYLYDLGKLLRYVLPRRTRPLRPLRQITLYTLTSDLLWARMMRVCGCGCGCGCGCAG